MSEPPKTTIIIDLVPDFYKSRRGLPGAWEVDNKQENCWDWGHVHEFRNDPPDDSFEKVTVKLTWQREGDEYYTLLGLPAKKAREEVFQDHGGKWEKDMEVNVYFMPNGVEMELRNRAFEMAMIETATFGLVPGAPQMG